MNTNSYWVCRRCNARVDIVHKRCECTESPSPWDLITEPEPSLMKRFLTFLSALFIASAAPAKTVEGIASWYGRDYDGKRMANGQRFDHRKPTLASYEFPLGTRVRITYTSDRGQVRTAEATVTDRGPHITGRSFDLSWALFKRLESPKKGLINVTVEAIK